MILRSATTGQQKHHMRDITHRVRTGDLTPEEGNYLIRIVRNGGTPNLPKAALRTPNGRPTITPRVHDALKRANAPVTNAYLRRVTGLTSTQVGSALSTLKRNGVARREGRNRAALWSEVSQLL